MKRQPYLTIRRILALALAVMLTVGMLPAQAFAVETTASAEQYGGGGTRG